MSVVTVHDPVTLKPNFVYVIPPGRQLHVTDDVVATAEVDVNHFQKGLNIPV